ncbi:MAG: hypothetical protein AAF577_06060 [Pseudomonadota bacterium]
MGMYGEVLAVGPFSPALVEHYDFPSRYYVGLDERTTIVTFLFGILEGSSATRDLANGLGITDCWDFNQHRLNPSTVDMPALYDSVARLSEGDSYRHDLKRLEAFLAQDYTCYFMPNG